MVDDFHKKGFIERMNNTLDALTPVIAAKKT